MRKRVVITGIGIWSCLGTNIEEVTESLRLGKSGIGFDTARKDYGYKCGLTGVVKPPQLKRLCPDRRTRQGMSEESQYAYMASLEAFKMAGVTQDYVEDHEIGILFGNDASAKAIVEADHLTVQYGTTESIGSGNVFQAMTSTVTMNLSNIFHLRGISLTVGAACASGSHAIGLGKTLIESGMQDMILCGGAQEVNKNALTSFDALGAFAEDTEAPAKASRPFDRDRTGLVPSGGAAALVLEDYAHAVARGAKILAEVSGYGFSTSRGGGVSRPSDEGSIIAMQRAMYDAGITEDEIDYINAHATSTPQGDATEAQALDKLFHGRKAWISSTKGMTGHECWMAGASEAVYSVLMMQNSFVAPNINFDNPDEYSAVLHLATETIETPVNTVLSNSFGFGGTNSALVINKLTN